MKLRSWGLVPFRYWRCDMHNCPGPLCTEQVSDEMLACRGHWFQVSRPARTLIWRTWRNGDGAGSDEHYNAMRLAIADMRPFKRDLS